MGSMNTATQEVTNKPATATHKALNGDQLYQRGMRAGRKYVKAMPEDERMKEVKRVKKAILDDRDVQGQFDKKYFKLVESYPEGISDDDKSAYDVGFSDGCYIALSYWN